MALRKNTGKDIREGYPEILMLGLVLALVLLIMAFRTEFRSESKFEVTMPEQETIKMEDIQQTAQVEKPPPPPRPPVPVEVPNDVVLDEEILDFTDLQEYVTPAELPPPPPPVVKEEVVEEVEPEIFVVVEQMPELIGGLPELQKRINYPDIAKRSLTEGRVTVQFVVTEDGTVADAVVIRGIGAGCDEEAVRAVSQARFKPGKQRGKPVRVRMSLPITFRLKKPGG